jgi:uncharacterized protein (DUF1778 family)
MASANQRVELRIAAPIKQRLQSAADALGLSLSAFVLEAAASRAQEVLLREQVLRLSPEAYDQLLADLEAPPKPPTPAMKALLEENSEYLKELKQYIFENPSQ